MEESYDPLDQLMTATAASMRLRITRATITNWATRGYRDSNGERRLLEPAGLNDHQKPMFRFRDILAAELATRAKAQRVYPTAA